LTGFYLNGITRGTLTNGAASIVYYRNGTVKIGAWGTEVRMTRGVVGVRQNLKLIVDHGQVPATVNQDVETNWGATLGGGYYVWRSGLGITKDGRVIFVYGPALNVRELHRGLRPVTAPASVTATTARPEQGRNWPVSVLRTARPRQWPKNLLVFAAPLAGATWGRGFGYALVATAAFGCASVAVYFVNDVLDAERDRRHPRKRHRPVAAGDLPKSHAVVIGAGCAAAGLAAGLVAELAGLGPAAIGHRPALRWYRPWALLAAQWITGAAMIAAYLAWAAGERTDARGWHLLSAIPLAAALAWFALLTVRRTAAPVEDLVIRDGPMLAWLALFVTGLQV
jgi:UbiA prenyltransferase family